MSDTTVVSLKECLRDFPKNKYAIPIILGKESLGNIIVKDLEDVGNILIAGATGTGKSMFMDTVLYTFLNEKKSEDLKFVLVGSGYAEFNAYEGVPYLAYPITDILYEDKAMEAISWCLEEIEGRKQSNKTEPNIVVFIAQFSFLVLNNKDAESQLCKLAKEGPKVGIHIIMHSSRASSNVFTKRIKDSFNGKIGFTLATEEESLNVLNQKGVEKLLGNGDMLYKDKDIKDAVRLQAPFVLYDEIKKRVNKVSSRKCLCDDPDCGKCLVINCQDDNCKVHTKEKKIEAKKRSFYPILKSLIESRVVFYPVIMRERFHMTLSQSSDFLYEFWNDEMKDFPYLYKRAAELRKSGIVLTTRVLQKEFSMDFVHAHKLLEILEEDK